jgi:hypothetical protein
VRLVERVSVDGDRDLLRELPGAKVSVPLVAAWSPGAFADPSTVA